MAGLDSARRGRRLHATLLGARTYEPPLGLKPEFAQSEYVIENKESEIPPLPSQSE